MTLTVRDRIEIAKLGQNRSEIERMEAAVYLVARFAEPTVSREMALDWSIEELIKSINEVMPRIAEAAKNGGEIASRLQKLHS